MPPPAGTPQRDSSLLLSSTRARAVPDVDIPATPLSEKGGRPRRDALIGVTSEIAALAAAPAQGAALQGVYGELADDMTALYRYRADTVAGLADAVSELLAAVGAAKRAAVAPASRAAHGARVADAEREKKGVVQEIVELRQRTADAGEEADGVERERREVEARAGREQQALRESLPVLDARVKLYGVVAKATLYEKVTEEGGVRETCVDGFVSDRTRRDVRPFRFSLADMSRFEAVNALWELL